MHRLKDRDRLTLVVHASAPGYTGGVVETVSKQWTQHGVKNASRFGMGPRNAGPDKGEDLSPVELVCGQGLTVHAQEHLVAVRTTERRRNRAAKRFMRELSKRIAARFPGQAAAPSTTARAPSDAIDNRLAFRKEVPFHSQRGDFAQPI